MSIQKALLALLCKGPQHGYQLKAEFDAATGEIWPLNFGQVYPALQRLRDRGLIDEVDAPESDKRAYEVTDEGRAFVTDWLGESVRRPLAGRDELSIKVLVAIAAGLADPVGIIEAQRAETMATLQSVIQMRAAGHDGAGGDDAAGDGAGGDDPEVDEPSRSPLGELAWQLHLDRMAMLTQSEIRWLDLVEERLIARPEFPGADDTQSDVSASRPTETEARNEVAQ